MNDELIYQISLPLVPNIGDVHTRLLIQHFGDAASVFKAKHSTLEKIEGIGTVRAASIKSFNDFSIAEKELVFLDKFGIKKLFITDPGYPRRLLHCYDAPVLLFLKGDTELNSARIVGIVGTRSASEYGKNITDQMVEALASHDVMIISGLALGIDATAHKAALKHNLTTVGVVAHGLHTIYPNSNTHLAKEMVKNKGCLVTEFVSGTKPEKHNFPLRNRIVAGLCDAILVIETHYKGGSMITAKLADSYNRDVFAVPGRITDYKSSGCNYLVKNNKAQLITEAEDLLTAMGWKEKNKKIKKQKELFVELSSEETSIFQLLEEKGPLSIDEINLTSGMSSSQTAAAILNLELHAMIECLPGKVYRLV
ncbi:MAG: DNA-protecting protein DprA [Flavisolibacter sp.]|nr:DNA-protecting protein DprA [Flavisolibacter sp.]